MDNTPSLRLEPGECLTLSPGSDRFKSAYRQVQLRRAEDVREYLGLSEAAAKALQSRSACCRPAAAFSPAADDLDATDSQIRLSARQAAYAGLQAYVRSPTPNDYAHLTPALDRYLEISRAFINIISLGDIDVAAGATLTISATTHVLNAHNVTIHTTGRIVCQGAITFKINALEGVRFSPLGASSLGAASSVAGALRH